MKTIAFIYVYGYGRFMIRPFRSGLGRSLSSLAFLLVVASTGAYAQLLNFDFTLMGTGQGAGTVTGEVIGLENNAVSSASNVIIDSAPSAFGLTFPYVTGASGGSFTVTNGLVTAVQFEGNSPDTDALLFFNHPNNTNEFFYDPNGAKAVDGEHYVENNLGFPAGLTFAPHLEVPEPTSAVLLLIAGLTACVAGKCRPLHRGHP